jgi:hypothetical protein
VTTEADEADISLQKAMERVLQLNGWLPAGWVMGDWVIMVSLDSFNTEDQQMTRYAQLLPESGMAWHRILGLINIGKEQLYEQMRNSSD